MKTLNLVDLEKSDIKYEIYRFPDGQQQVKIPLKRTFYNTGTSRMEGYKYQDWNVENKNIVQIKSRLNNFKDLELIICATKSLRELGVKEIHLYTPYFLGSRSDRKFEEGSNNYLKDVICPIINSLKFESVTVLDPHSSTLEACLTNFKEISNLELVRFALNDQNFKGDFKNDFILMSPDAGASKKIYNLADQIDYPRKIITCIKARNVKGNILQTVVKIEYDETDDIILIDDICDGGATFEKISTALDTANHKGKRYLIVTHGIFSKGFKELNQHFDGIYCTNSYRDIADDEYGEITNVKQLNVF